MLSFSFVFLRKNASDNILLNRRWGEFEFVEKAAILFLLSTPVFFLSVKHWVTNASVLGCLFAIYALHLRRREFRIFNVPWIFAVLLVCLGYTVAIFVSQLGRWSFDYKAYLDQTRWVLGLPIFLFIYWSRVNFARALDVLAPACVVFAYISSTYVLPSDAWGWRATVSFMDPLAFGFMSLSISLLCFASLIFDVKRGAYDVLSFFKLIGFLTGVYLSIRTGSRSGWGAVPFVLFLVTLSAFRLDVRKTLMIFFGVCIFTLGLYFLSENVHERVNHTIGELIQYPWSGGVAPDGPVSIRITCYRLGYYYFSQSPLFGWGERGYGAIKDASELILFSSQYARDFAYGALFHSEWTTQAVRFGALGLIAVGIVFLVPGAIFFHTAFFGEGRERQVACMGMAYVICQLAASVGDEVFNSKAMVTFTVLVLMGLLATLARVREAATGSIAPN